MGDTDKHYLNRGFGEIYEHDHRAERNGLIVAGILILIIDIVLCWYVVKGFYILILLAVIISALIPLFFFVIRIPMVIVLEVNLGDYDFKYKSRGKNPKTGLPNTEHETYKLIDLVNIYYIPYHLLCDWDIVGNMPPLRNNNGETIYIADKVDIQNKIIHLPFDERFSNLRYIVHKRTWLELKSITMKYIQKTLRMMLTQEITVGFKLQTALQEYLDGTFKKPETYLYQTNLGMEKTGQYNNLYANDAETLKAIQDLLAIRQQTQTQKNMEGQHE